MKQRLDFKTNYIFPTPTRYLGYLITIIGIIGVFSLGLVTLFISLLGIVLSFTRFGVVIQKDDSKQPPLKTEALGFRLAP